PAALHRADLPGGTTRRGARAEPQYRGDPRPVQRAGLQSQRLRRRRRSGLLAPPQRERGPPAVRPHHPGTVPAGTHLEAGPGDDGAAARHRHATVAHADPLPRRLPIRQPVLPLLVGPRARRPGPRRCDRAELRCVLLSAGPEARPHVDAGGRHGSGVPFPHRHRSPRRDHLRIPGWHRLLRPRLRPAPLDGGGGVAGNTGHSQSRHGPGLCLFIGIAPAEKPEIVVGAIVEFAREGPYVAPLVTRVIGHYLGVDTTLASKIRIVLPTDTAPHAT